MRWEAPLPLDFAQLLEALRVHAHGAEEVFSGAFHVASGEEGWEIDEDGE